MTERESRRTLPFKQTTTWLTRLLVPVVPGSTRSNLRILTYKFDLDEAGGYNMREAKDLVSYPPNLRTVHIDVYPRYPRSWHARIYPSCSKDAVERASRMLPVLQPFSVVPNINVRWIGDDVDYELPDPECKLPNHRLYLCLKSRIESGAW